MKSFKVDPDAIYHRGDLDKALRECGTSLDAILERAGIRKTAFRFSILGSELLDALARAKTLAQGHSGRDLDPVSWKAQPPQQNRRKAPLRPVSVLDVSGGGTSATTGRDGG
jgi:hypothetical protein